MKRLRDEELLEMLDSPESDRVERKRSFKGDTRTSARQAIANEQEERVLNEKRLSRNLPFDLRPVFSAKLSDLSYPLFEGKYLKKAFDEETLAANNRSYEEKLAACKMIVSPSDTTPTVLGLLTLGERPSSVADKAIFRPLRILSRHYRSLVSMGARAPKAHL